MEPPCRPRSPAPTRHRSGRPQDRRRHHAPGRTTAAPAPGTLALTIGRSEDSGVNATLGIISACSGEWRTWRGGRLDHYIRLDLTLYPGSDGGAVVSTAGETIGIATSALSRIAGLAIPAVTRRSRGG
jgi:S1-C subfamily serine protease